MAVLIDYLPQPKQLLMHNSKARQILAGGAAGGGKSKALRWDCVFYCLRNPGLEAYLFRRTYKQLEDNHIRPLLRELPWSVAQYRPSKGTFEFHNGSRIILGHCENTHDYLKYQGAEMHMLAIDEAGLFEPIQIIELRSRVRLGEFASKVSTPDRKYLPRCIMSSNPGGPSHNFLKRTFISPGPPMTIFYDDTLKDPSDPNDKGWSTVYIPARMSDNKYLDPGYASVFAAMSPDRARALREGDWDAVEGAALHLLDRSRHMIRRFEIPQHWTTFMSMDWGTSAPFSVGWYCVAGEDALIQNDSKRVSEENPSGSVFIPQGAVIRFAELYGWTGRENEGVRKTSAEVAREIMEVESNLKIRTPEYRVADSAMWAQFDGPSPAERMMSATDGHIILSKSRKDRIANYDEICCRLAGNPFLKSDGKVEVQPMVFITENCIQAWRTLPSLLLDPMHPDKGPGDFGETHVYDEMAYALATRPYAVSKRDRDLEEWEETKRDRRKDVDHYATS